MNDDTICSIITPPLMSAVGMIRVSGKRTLQIIDGIFSKNISDKPSHTIHHGFIQDAGGNIIDDVVISVYKGPNSYTGEDVAEISCHGSVFVLNKVISLLISSGARQAGNGEFSKRAFMNGKMDIAQAEAVIDLIEAESEKEAAVALNHLKGHLSQEVERIRQNLIGVSAQILAYIDYPDDEIGEISNEEIKNIISAELEAVKKLEKSFSAGKIIKNGLKACLLGKPNVGKSFLMNRLLGYERSIVTETAGTTRDIVEEAAVIAGIKVYISDMAGIRETSDEAERIGVRMAAEKLEAADIIICVFDLSGEADEEDIAVINMVFGIGGSAKKIAVFNKSDKEAVFDTAVASGFDKTVTLSAKENNGICGLERVISELFTGGLDVNRNEIITNERQYQCIVNAKSALERGLLNCMMTPDVIMVDIEEAIEALTMFTGKSVSQEIIENIFSRFCVGK